MSLECFMGVGVDEVDEMRRSSLYAHLDGFVFVDSDVIADDNTEYSPLVVEFDGRLHPDMVLWLLDRARSQYERTIARDVAEFERARAQRALSRGERPQEPE